MNTKFSNINNNSRTRLYSSQVCIRSYPYVQDRYKLRQKGLRHRVCSAQSASTDAQQFEKDYVQQEGELQIVCDQCSDSQRIVFRTNAQINVDEVAYVNQRVGWDQRPRDKVNTALQNSFLTASLHLITTKEGKQVERLIGLARATSDHVFNAQIWDVVIDPDFQGQGLGQQIVTEMIQVLLAKDIVNITLFADKDVTKFYKNLGFDEEPNGIKGMFWSPK